MWKIILAAIAGIILLILFLRVKVVVEEGRDAPVEFTQELEEARCRLRRGS